MDSSETESSLELALPIHTIPSRLHPVQSRPPPGEKEDGAEDTARHIKGFRWVLVCISIYISAFLYGLDTTIAADVQGSVIDTFGHVNQLSWLGAGFPLGSVAVILPVTDLYTSFNMKWTFVGSIALFEIGSAICGAAPSMSALIVGRVIAGAGGTGIYLGDLNYFSSMTTPRERGFYITFIGFCWGMGAILGPVVGGAFSGSAATWRWAFYINLVIGAISAPVYLFFLPALHPVTGVSIRSRLANLDFVGFVLGAGVWSSFTIALIMAGGQWPWDDGRTIATFIVFGVVTVLYTVQQIYCIFTTPETRSFPVQLIADRTQFLLYVATSANNASLFVIIYFIPIYFQFVHGDGALMAAVRLLPFVTIFVTVNVSAGYMLSRIRIYMPIYIVSGILLTLGGALLTVYLDPSTPVGVIYGLTIITAAGTGLTTQLGYAIATLTVPTKDIGDAISLQNISQVGSYVIALAIAGQIFQSEAVANLEAVLDGLGFSHDDIVNAVAGAQSALFEQLSGDLRTAAVLAITKAMQKSFVLLSIGGGVLLIAAMLMKRERLFGQIITA
ncbi:major facilitator superfamily-domain-containing protein [Xylariales sp. PMI_506]|nr:major facilitator superfamily-domain-containing protein [Xylariales sp. PMI_506]